MFFTLRFDLLLVLDPRDHVRESMKDLHWLPIAHRIKFKLCIIMHGTICGQSPSYIRDLLVPVSEMQGRTRLRSAAAELYDVSFTKTQFGRRAFSVAAPSEWNSGTVFQSISNRFPILDNLKER